MLTQFDYPRKYRKGSNLKKRICKLSSFFSILFSIIYIWLSWQPWSLWQQEKIPFHGNLQKEERQHFEYHWCRLQKSRVDWKGILSPCSGNTYWGKVPLEWQNKSLTDALTSYINLWDINPAGEFSRFSIQSQTKDGKRKLIGGDAWRVHVSGPTYISPTIIDHSNGSYEVLFLAMEPGEYHIEIILDYSLCNGLRDPPVDWFVKGNSQGKNQRYPEVDKSRDYLLAQLWDKVPVDITIPPATARGSSATKQELLARQARCSVGCRLLWDGYGRWNNSDWIPFVQNVPLYHSPHTDQGTLHLYGDSVMDFFATSLKYREICRGFFNKCEATYNWVYPVMNYTIARRQTDDLDFDIERVLESIRGVLTGTYMDRHSVFIINCGLHYVESVNFTSYQKLIDGLIKVFHEKYLDPSSNVMQRVFEGRIVWKTTTAINKERATNINLGHRRFFTYQRVLLYNAYATWAMCQAGVEILDVFPMSDSYPWGTGTHGSRIPARNDVVHYNNLAFKPVEDLLETMFHP